MKEQHNAYTEKKSRNCPQCVVTLSVAKHLSSTVDTTWKETHGTYREGLER
nr:hypothetical protein [Halorubrum sp. Atlit-26R]